MHFVSQAGCPDRGIFALWVTVYFGQFFENYNLAQNFGLLFSEKQLPIGRYTNFDKLPTGLSISWPTFSQSSGHTELGPCFHKNGLNIHTYDQIRKFSNSCRVTNLVRV
jgi:hypothetical protein